MHRRSLLICGATAAIGIALTSLIALLPAARFAYFAPGVRTATETTVALVSLLTAYLVSGRFLRSRELCDLLLTSALVTFAATSICFGAIPAALADDATAGRLSWGAIAARLIGAALLASAALAHPSRARVRRPGPLAALAVPLLPIVALVAALEEFSERIPRGPLLQRSAAIAAPGITVSSPVVACQVALMLLFAVAAVGYARRADRVRDGFLSWLAVAGVLAALGQLNVVLYPALDRGWMQVGDAFRVAFYLVMLLGAGWEIQRYWASLSAAATLEERRRIARDLHDGLAQEVAYIGRQVQLLDQEEPAVGRIAAASTRALAESRRAIALLGRGPDEPFERSFADAVRDVAARVGVDVEVVVATRDRVGYEAADALTRIACEAIANAGRHGRAGRVLIELRGVRPLRLRVSDDGGGFSLAEVAGRARGGYGLRGMQERVAALGGELRIEAAPGRGTRIEAVI